jgi:hypothetical protein
MLLIQGLDGMVKQPALETVSTQIETILPA